MQLDPVGQRKLCEDESEILASSVTADVGIHYDTGIGLLQKLCKQDVS